MLAIPHTWLLFEGRFLFGGWANIRGFTIYIYTYKCKNIRTCVYVCIHTRTHIHTHTHTHIYMYIYVYAKLDTVLYLPDHTVVISNHSYYTITYSSRLYTMGTGGGGVPRLYVVVIKSRGQKSVSRTVVAKSVGIGRCQTTTSPTSAYMV